MELYSARSLLTTLALLTATLGCGSQGAGGTGENNGSGGQSGTGSGATTGGGCSPNDCGGCGDCITACYCQTADMNGCVTACKTGAAGNGGAAGTGQPGTGGTGQPGTGGTGTGTGGTGTGTGGTGTGTGGTGAGGGAAQEIRLTMAPFTVGAGSETFKCQNFKNPLGGQDIIFNKTESFMTTGSHHMFVFEQAGVTADGPLESESNNCNGLQFNTLVHSAQTPQVTTAYPPGVGVKMHGNMGFRIISHYFNPTNQALTAQVSIILYLVPASQVQSYAASLFANTLGTTIRANSTATWRASCAIPREANLLFAVSHMHSHATHFIARTNTGQVIYETTQWDEPTAAAFQPSPGATLPPLKIAAGSTINYECQYNNTSSASLTFCESAKTCEMCILTARYFPAPDGQAISCLY